jgi:hypothetical protein
MLLVPGAETAERASEYKIKTAYLYNIAKFVKWPDDQFPTQQSNINICVVGQNPFGELIDILTRKTAQGRQFTLYIGRDPALLSSCHVVFFPQTYYAHNVGLLDEIKMLPILTVGEGEEFAQGGGIISFVVQRDTVSFILNLNSASQANLSVSAKLAEVANQVIKK